MKIEKQQSNLLDSVFSEKKTCVKYQKFEILSQTTFKKTGKENAVRSSLKKMFVFSRLDLSPPLHLLVIKRKKKTPQFASYPISREHVRNS